MAGLRYHIQRFHLSVGRYRCPCCSKVLLGRRAFRSHCNSQHPTETLSLQVCRISSSPPLPFSCVDLSPRFLVVGGANKRIIDNSATFIFIQGFEQYECQSPSPVPNDEGVEGVELEAESEAESEEEEEEEEAMVLEEEEEEEWRRERKGGGRRSTLQNRVKGLPVTYPVYWDALKEHERLCGEFEERPVEGVWAPDVSHWARLHPR